uniref:Uncharacterized protein n=1 Tax=Avena sativa TaxID=4498 RepID=A0ACD5TQL0_AVESA
MKRTRAQNPKVQDAQDPSAAQANPKPQRKPKQPRQPKAAGTGGKKASAAAAAAREAAAATAAAASSSAASSGAETAPVVPDVGGGVEVAGAGGLPADWDEMDAGLGSNGSPWWTFGVEEEKLLGWFPFVEEDFGGCHGAGAAAARDHEAAAFDDDIWRIHQIYEIPSYAAK